VVASGVSTSAAWPLIQQGKRYEKSQQDLYSILVSGGLDNFSGAQTPPASLRGVVTDPSGALVPGGLVQLRDGGEQRASTDQSGQYVFPSLRPGKYLVRVIVKGFSVNQKQNFEIAGPTSLDVQLVIAAGSAVVNVEDEAGRVGTDPTFERQRNRAWRERARSAIRRPRRVDATVAGMGRPSSDRMADRSISTGHRRQSASKASIREVPSTQIRYRRSSINPALGASRSSPSRGATSSRQAFFSTTKKP